MPKVKTQKTKYPEGWELVSPVLEEFGQKMRDGKLIFSFHSFNVVREAQNWYIFVYFLILYTAENDPHEGKRKAESVWPIFRIHHQRTRYIYELFYKKKEITRELYDFLLREGYADANLIAKWKKVCDISYQQLYLTSFELLLQDLRSTLFINQITRTTSIVSFLESFYMMYGIRSTYHLEINPVLTCSFFVYSYSHYPILFHPSYLSAPSNS